MVEDPLEQAAHWRDAGLGVALATVIETWGSSPRPAGSQLVVSSEGAFTGSVSGGCVEGAVVEGAREVIASGEPTQLEFGVTDEQAWEVGLACGGRIRIYVERVGDDPILDELRSARATRRGVARWVELASGRVGIVHGEPSEELAPDLVAAVRAAVASDLPRILPRDAGPLFVQPFNPPLRLVIVGAVHIAQELAPLAARAGYDVTVVDPRSAFATEERFPGVRLDRRWPDAALGSIGLDRRSAVVTLTHDAKLDDPALVAALGSEAFYVGALGSRRNQERRLERLRGHGFGSGTLARVHGPVGLDIGARTPAEIAVSIVAELTASLRTDAG